METIFHLILCFSSITPSFFIDFLLSSNTPILTSCLCFSIFLPFWQRLVMWLVINELWGNSLKYITLFFPKKLKQKMIHYLCTAKRLYDDKHQIIETFLIWKLEAFRLSFSAPESWNCSTQNPHWRVWYLFVIWNVSFFLHVI
jgi:hypothetical protein